MTQSTTLHQLQALYEERVADLLPLARIGLSIVDACKAGSRHFHISDEGLADHPSTERARQFLGAP